MRLIALALTVTALLVVSETARAITFTPGHIYATSETAITEFDGNGVRLGSLSLPGSRLWSGAFGRDGLLYVTRGDATVQAIRADGTVVRTYTFQGVSGLVNNGIAFDPSGESFYVNAPGSIYKFDVDSSFGTQFATGYYTVATLPNGEVLATTGSNLMRYSSSGEYLGGIGDAPFGIGFLEDPYDVTPDDALFLSDVRGIAYDPGLDRTFIFQMGYGGGGGDFYYQLFALQGLTNVLLDVTRFEIGNNLALGSNGQLLVGGFRSAPGILDAATLDLVTRLPGTPTGDEFAFISVMPLPEPTPLAALCAVSALLGWSGRSRRRDIEPRAH